MHPTPWRPLGACLLLLVLGRSTPAASDDTPVDALARGASVAQRCASCHRMEPEGRSRWGPSLLGVMGRPMGAEPSYRYGSYLRTQGTSGAVWSEDALRLWLQDSKAMARASDARTKMPAQRLTDAEIDDLLVFLRTLR